MYQQFENTMFSISYFAAVWVHPPVCLLLDYKTRNLTVRNKFCGLSPPLILTQTMNDCELWQHFLLLLKQYNFFCWRFIIGSVRSSCPQIQFEFYVCSLRVIHVMCWLNSSIYPSIYFIWGFPNGLLNFSVTFMCM